MIYIDSRAGSKELAPHLDRLGMSTDTTHLAFGDFAFTGNGPAGVVLVGIERKRLGDLIACMCDGRFEAAQLPGLLDEYHFAELIVEGEWRPGKHGELLERKSQWREVPRGSATINYRRVTNYIYSLSKRLPVWRTGSISETAHVLVARWHWWQHRWTDHHLNTLHTPPLPAEARIRPTDSLEVQRHKLAWAWAAQLPGVGVELGRRIADKVKTGRGLVGESGLTSIPGLGPRKEERIRRLVG